MDLISTFIGLGLLALGLIPFYFIRVSKSKKEKGLLDALKQHFHISNGTKLLKESCAGYLIALDPSKKELFFIRKAGEGNIFNSVSIAEIRKVELDIQKLVSEVGSEKYTKVDRLELAFFLKTGQKMSFLAYDSQDGESLGGQLYMLSEWQKKIEKLIV